MVASKDGFVPSSLLDATMLEDLATAFKKVGADKYTAAGKWSKVFECNEMYLDNIQFDSVIKAI